MIVPWFNSRRVTPMITCDLVRINADSKFCRIDNKHNLKFPTLFLCLEVMTIVCYSNYLLYLLIGAIFLILQTPVVIFLAIKNLSMLNTFDAIKKLPKAVTHKEYVAGKAKLQRHYLKLARDYSRYNTRY